MIKTKEDLNRARKECVAELGILPAKVEEYKKKVFTEEGVTPCYLRCIFTRLGLFDDKMGFITESYMAQLGKGETARAGVTGCFDNSGTDTCLWAYRGFTCFTKRELLPEGY